MFLAEGKNVIVVIINPFEFLYHGKVFPISTLFLTKMKMKILAFFQVFVLTLLLS